MKEPTTVAEAKRLTLEKIKGCMERPEEERGKFWIETIWDNRNGLDRYCAFCIVVDCDTNTSPVCLKACRYYSRSGSANWSISFLSKLYRMVEEIEG